MSTPTNKQAAAIKGRWQELGLWSRIGVSAAALVLVLAVLVLVARLLVGLAPVASFIETYPGHSELPAGAPVVIPAWLGWQHFINMFLILLIIRSGWQVRTTKRPAAHWIRNNKGLIKTPGNPTKISLDLWFHLTLDALWVLNGIIFIIVLFATGQWMRIVPTSWDVFPNAISSELQCLSLDRLKHNH